MTPSLQLRVDVSFAGRELVFALWARNLDASPRYVHHLGGFPLRPTAHLSVRGHALHLLFGDPPPPPGVHFVCPVLAAATRLAPQQELFFETRVEFPLEIPASQPGEANVTDAVFTVEHRAPHPEGQLQPIEGSDAFWAFGGPVDRAIAQLRLPGPFAVRLAGPHLATPQPTA